MRARAWLEHNPEKWGRVFRLREALPTANLLAGCFGGRRQVRKDHASPKIGAHIDLVNNALGSKLDAWLRLHPGGEMVLHQCHFSDEVGSGDEFRLGVAAGDHDMQA